MEILWEVEYFEAPADQRSRLRNRPQKRPLRGMPVRRIDHVNLMAREVPPVRTFFQEHLGFRLREQKIGQEGVEVGAWLSVSPLVHELAVMRDATGTRGRFHHLAYWYGYPQHLLDAADLCADYDVRIEADPAWKTVVWDVANEADLEKSSIWFGSRLPETFYTYGTPPLER